MLPLQLPLLIHRPPELLRTTTTTPMTQQQKKRRDMMEFPDLEMFHAAIRAFHLLCSLGATGSDDLSNPPTVLHLLLKQKLLLLNSLRNLSLSFILDVIGLMGLSKERGRSEHGGCERRRMCTTLH